MGRIFIATEYGEFEQHWSGLTADPIQAQDREIVGQILNLVTLDLRSRGFDVLAVPNHFTVEQKAAWMNHRYVLGDVALFLNADAFGSSQTRGASVFYIPLNDQRRSHAELLLFALLRRVPQLPSRGAKPDTVTALGYLGICRWLAMPSLLMHVGFLSNPEDRELLQTRQRDVALGISDGTASWSRAIAEITTPDSPLNYPMIRITLNGGIYGNRGILVNGNAYIPIDLVDQLGIDLTTSPSIRRLQYWGGVYVKAIDLREYHVAVQWDGSTKTLALRSSLALCTDRIGYIMGQGHTSDVQLMMFLKTHNENALVQFPDIPKLYREEALLEGVNHDVAMAQMCLETQFLQFNGIFNADQNNFAQLGDANSAPPGAIFPSSRVGIRAHIQHLKAYGSGEPLVQEQVDPRFDQITRGIAPSIFHLSSRWSADPRYGEKVLAILRRLYESADLL